MGILKGSFNLSVFKDPQANPNFEGTINDIVSGGVFFRPWNGLEEPTKTQENNRKSKRKPLEKL